MGDDVEEVINGTCWYFTKPRNATYLDDVMAGDRSLELAWWDTLNSIAQLVVKGLPLGASKCNWLAERVTVLGVELLKDEYNIGKKVQQKL